MIGRILMSTWSSRSALENPASVNQRTNADQRSTLSATKSAPAAFFNQEVLNHQSRNSSYRLLSLFRKANEEKSEDEKKSQEIGRALHAAVKNNNADEISEFATGQLKKIPENERLEWLRKIGADKAMCATVRNGSPEAIKAWGEVVELLPGKLKFAFLDKRAKDDGSNSIACRIFNNTQPGAMKAWGEVLELIPNTNQERSKLLLTREEHDFGTPGLANLFERGDVEALNEFVKLADKHLRLGNDDLHSVLLDCVGATKTLTRNRGKVSGKDAWDWVRQDGLKYVKPRGLYGDSAEVAKAYGKLVRQLPSRYRMDILLPDDVWTNQRQSPRRKAEDDNGLFKYLHADQARELAHSITMLRAMVPTMTTAERTELLNEIRSRHATKRMWIWVNKDQYKYFKKAWPVVDVMLLDLKKALTQKQLPNEDPPVKTKVPDSAGEPSLDISSSIR